MARRTTHDCGFRKVRDEDPYPVGRSRRCLTWCGKVAFMTERERDNHLKMVTCPKCSAAIGKHKLKSLPRVALLRVDPLGWVKSSYEFRVDGAVRGYIHCTEGWGSYWTAHRLAGPNDYSQTASGPSISGQKESTYRVLSERWVDGVSRRTFWPVHWASKESMAVAMWHAFERNELPNVAELEAEHLRRQEEDAERKRESAIRVEERRIENEKAQNLRQERLEAWAFALESLRARTDLSNVQIAGIEAAAALIGGLR